MLAASYAKINLFLEVLGKLPHNYHQVNTVLSSIDLCDFISYEPLDTPVIKLSCSNPVLATTENLIYKVAFYIQQHYKPDKGISIHLDKQIPIAAGLGGGSSNAANCMLALNQLWQLELDYPELHSIAATFGSDLNFFLSGGTALGENRGEVITQLPDIWLTNLLLVNPNIPIPSAAAYGLVEIPTPDSIRHFDSKNVLSSVFNRLEPGIRQAYPAIDALLNKLHSYGADFALLSGSGSTCFGHFRDLNSMKACQAHFSSLGYWTFVAKTLPRHH